MDVAPDAIQKLGFVERTSFGCRQRDQQFQRFGAQGNFVSITTEQPASFRLDDKSVESDGLRLGAGECRRSGLLGLLTWLQFQHTFSGLSGRVDRRVGCCKHENK